MFRIFQKSRTAWKFTLITKSKNYPCISCYKQVDSQRRVYIIRSRYLPNDQFSIGDLVARQYNILAENERGWRECSNDDSLSKSEPRDVVASTLRRRWGSCCTGVGASPGRSRAPWSSCAGRVGARGTVSEESCSVLSVTCESFVGAGVNVDSSQSALGYVMRLESDSTFENDIEKTYHRRSLRRTRWFCCWVCRRGELSRQFHWRCCVARSRRRWLLGQC